MNTVIYLRNGCEKSSHDPWRCWLAIAYIHLQIQTRHLITSFETKTSFLYRVLETIGICNSFVSKTNYENSNGFSMHPKHARHSNAAENSCNNRKPAFRHKADILRAKRKETTLPSFKVVWHSNSPAKLQRKIVYLQLGGLFLGNPSI